MKQKEAKHGGKRLGAGRPHKWQGGQTKLVRIPISYVDKILRVVAYMDSNKGELPLGIAFFTEEDFSLPGYDALQEIPYPRRYRSRG
ncbi:hypothetical protein [Microcoleus sp. MON2_D5]|uniref:hypothetical protein n=1 Tax=Microcoleus sp. MON2_D5 TaxID=2818833 RepID=UPI002FD6D94A